MEAKVDIRKLQFLNDRIAQVTDALNQVRLSVHGLQQPAFGPQQSQFAFQQPQFGFQQPQLGYQPQFGFQQPPFGYQQPQLGFQQQLPYGLGPIGFQHTPYSSLPSTVPFGPLGWQGGFQSPMAGGQGLQQQGAYGSYAPYLAHQGITGIQGMPGIGQAGWGGSPSWFPSLGGGLYHSPTELMEQRLSEQRANDPNRILQTFPLCLIPVSSAATW